MRDNVQAEGSEDYFRESITVTVLNYTLNQKKTIYRPKHVRQNRFETTVGFIYY